MKPILLLALFLITGAAFAQQKKDPSIPAIEKVLYAQQEAWNEGNIDKYMEGYWHSDSLKFIGKKGITSGWQATLENYKKGYPDKATMGVLTFTLLSEEKLGHDCYMIIGKWQLHREKDDVGGHFSLIWKKINGKWLIVTDHTS